MRNLPNNQTPVTGKAAEPKPLGIIELLQRVGEERIRLQNLTASMGDISLLKNGDSKITFYTDQLTPNEYARGTKRRMGLILWIPIDAVEQAKVAHAKGDPINA